MSDNESMEFGEQHENNEQESQASKPMTGKKRSKVWIDFREETLKEDEPIENKRARCIHCGQTYLCQSKKYGNHNMKKHLKRCQIYLDKQSTNQTKITFEEGDETRMTAWKFDQNKSRKGCAHMIIVDDLPLSHVECSGFRYFNRVNQPAFKVPSRGTITKDCLALYVEEKNKLRETFRKNIGRVCLTTDTWTSSKQESYMALTAHYIDNNWKLNKNVLNYRHIDGHAGIDIGEGIETCLKEWELENIMTISVDNASANNGAIEFLTSIFSRNPNVLMRGKYIHMRCAAHVVNLVVQDGMKVVDNSIKSIRLAVKWIKNYGSRIEKFNKCARITHCTSTKSLVLDVPTRWNSTYNMLNVAQAYELAFERYFLEDATFGQEMVKQNLSVLTPDDWEKAKTLCVFLKKFSDITLKFSGTKYVTSHLLVVEMAKIRALLRKQLDCDLYGEEPEDKHLYDIATVMKPKFDKYYGHIESMNELVYVALVLDPRNKYEFLKIVLDDHYGCEVQAFVQLKMTYIKDILKYLYNDYERIHGQRSTSSSTTKTTPTPTPTPTSTSTTTNPDYEDVLRSKMKRSQDSSLPLNELDKYIGEMCEDLTPGFDLLLWWKVNSTRFPILSLISRDVFAIPISTVASESVFRTSGRVLDLYRSSLGEKTTECLVCAQDWLRISLNPEKDEDMETIAQIEKDLVEQERTTT